MVSKFAIILTNILLASGVLAVPSSSSRLEARLAHRSLREKRQSPHIFDNGNWAGAALTKSEGTFTTVTGTFTIPTLRVNGSDSSATIWVGIDGPICRSAIFQAGVDLVVKDGKASYDSWVEWYPAGAYYFPEFPISGGDEIRSTVTASSKNSGNVTIENLTTHQTVTKEVSSPYYSLCKQDAEWVVEDFMQDIDFADFGTIKFTNASASGPGGSNYTPGGADIIYDIQQDNGMVLTSVSASGNTVSVKRV